MVYPVPMKKVPAGAAVRLEDSFAYLVYRSARLLRYHFIHFTARLGLEISQEQFFLLNKLGESPGLSQTELGDGHLGDRPNITRMIATMEANGWLRRKVDPLDARRFQVSLTRKGALVHRRLSDAIGGERARLSAGLTAADLADLKRILAKVDANVVGLLDPDAARAQAR